MTFEDNILGREFAKRMMPIEVSDSVDPELMIVKIMVRIQETISVLQELDWIQTNDKQHKIINNAVMMLTKARRDMNEALELLCSGH